jgi:hypothetical protein
MQKALNLTPELLLNRLNGGPNPVDVQRIVKSPDACDSIITWAPSQSNMGPNWWQSSWEQCDQAIEWALSTGKRTYVCISSPNYTDPSDYSLRLGWVCKVIERYPEASIVVSNEPVFAHIDSKTSAQLIKDATEYAASLKSGSKHLLGPAEATFWGTPNVLKHLLTWKPPKNVRVDVAVHHYYDLVNGGARQIRTALASLVPLRWNPNLFLTEGGFQYHTQKTPGWNIDNPANPATWEYTSRVADEATQQRRVPLHYNWCAKQKRIALWANYEYVDSLWGGWASGLIGHDGTPHPVLPEWLKL